MPKSKVRTDDWVKLATEVMSARGALRLAFLAAAPIKKAEAEEEKTCAWSKHVWVEREAIREVLKLMGQAGTILTAALKERKRGKKKD